MTSKDAIFCCRAVRRVCSHRIDLFAKFSPLAVALCITALPEARGATLLSSPVMTGSFGSAAPGGGFTDTGSGRVGGTAVPTGIGGASITTSLPTVAPATEDRGEPSSRSRRSEARPRSDGGKKLSGSKSDETDSTPARHSRQHEETAPVEPADGKTQLVATTARSPWSAELGWAWYSDYQSFRGVNILDSVSSENGNNGVVTTSLKVGYSRAKDAFTAGFNYWQGLDRITPKGGQFDVPPNSGRKDGKDFALPSRDRYAEYNINLAYAYGFFDNKLIGTVGYNHFHFSNANFYKGGAKGESIPYANELTLGLAYTALPYVQPSFTWSHDFDGFKGDFFELRVDSSYNLYSRGDFSVRLRPYVSLSYDGAYNGVDYGWNSAEAGLNVPIQLNSVLTMTLTGNYVYALADSAGQPRASDGFWGGLRFSANWGGPSQKAELPGSGKDAKLVAITEPGEKPWEVSVGSGWRQINYGFVHGSFAPNSPLSYTKQTTRGALAFAKNGEKTTYDNGSIDATTPAVNGFLGLPIGGTGTFATANDFQVIGSPGQNAQVRFSTNQYFYTEKSDNTPSNANDQDSVLSPYIDLSREVWRGGSWSLRGGVLYAFSNSEGDSGYRIARLDRVFERTDTNGFVYSLDNIAQLNQSTLVKNLVVAPSTYVAALAAPGVGAAVTGVFDPQFELTRTNREILRIGTFVRSNLDVNAHDLSLPLSVRYDFGNRIHAEVTVAPTLTLATADFDTDVERRLLDDASQPRVTNVSKASPLANAQITLGGARPSLVPPGSNVASVAQPATPKAQVFQNQSAGGKSSLPKSPKYPGSVLDRKHYSDSATEVLFGVNAGASLILDLNEERTYFIELYGRYQWVQDFALNNGKGTANIDLSSFQAGFGLGFRF